MPGRRIAVIWLLAWAGTPLASTTYSREVGCWILSRTAAEVMPSGPASASATCCRLAAGISGGSAVTV